MLERLRMHGQERHWPVDGRQRGIRRGQSSSEGVDCRLTIDVSASYGESSVKFSKQTPCYSRVFVNQHLLKYCRLMFLINCRCCRVSQ